MGNIDTKLNFRKAIVQLGAKNQVKKMFHSSRAFFSLFRSRVQYAIGSVTFLMDRL